MQIEEYLPALLKLQKSLHNQQKDYQTLLLRRNIYPF